MLQLIKFFKSFFSKSTSEELPGQVYKANVHANVHIGDAKKLGNNFFPSEWTRKQVIQKIMEAYDDAKNNGICAGRPDGKYVVTGKTKEGIPVRMLITKDAEMKIAYPLVIIERDQCHT